MHTEHNHTTGKLTMPENDLHENLEYFFNCLMMAIKFLPPFFPVHKEKHTTHPNAVIYRMITVSFFFHLSKPATRNAKKIGCSKSKYKSKDVQENILLLL